MRKILGKILLVVAIIIMNFTTCFAYSDDLFKFDIPEQYKLTKNGYQYQFINTKNRNRTIMIQVRENNEIKRSVWDIEDSDLNRFKNLMSYSSQVVNIDKKAKLGKEKAVKIVLKERLGNEHMEMYLLASNKYIYVVGFTGISQQELNNSEYQEVKDSFKLKDRTTNYKVVFVLITIGVYGLSMYIKHKKRMKKTYQNNLTPVDNDITHL